MSDLDVSDDNQGRPGHIAADPAPADRARNAITVPAFRFLWINNVFFFLVINAQRFVFSWLVLDGLGGDEASQGQAVFALGIPSIFLVLHAGVWADRHDRKRLLVASQVASLVVMAATAVLIATDNITFTVVIVLSLVAGAAAAVGQPVRASLVPALVSREQLVGAIALTALAMTLSMILGPVLSKVVGDQFGFDGAFWFLTALLAAGLLALAPLRVPDRQLSAAANDEPSPEPSDALNDPAKPSVWSETKEALGHVIADRSLRKLFFLLSVAGLTVNPAVMVTLQAFVKEELGRDAGDAAPLFALMGVGLAISSVFVMRKGDMANKGAAFQRALMVGSSMTFLMGRTTSYAQLFPLVLMMGLGGGFYINMNQALIQANTPQRLMGRVMGLYTLVAAGLLPFGALIIGIIASSIGIGNTISLVAGIAFVTVVAVYVADEELRSLS